MKKAFLFVALTLIACSTNPTTPAPIPLPPQYPTPKLGPANGLYGRASSHTSALTAAGGSASDSVPADTSWAPFTAGTRLQVIQRLEVGADGSTFSAIAGFYDSQLGLQCTLMTLGAKRYCIPRDLLLETILIQQGSMNSDCSNMGYVYRTSTGLSASYYVGMVNGESHLYAIDPTPHSEPAYWFDPTINQCQQMAPMMIPGLTPFDPPVLDPASMTYFIDTTSYQEGQFVEFTSIN